MAKRPNCLLCDKQLQHEYRTELDRDGNPVEVLVEKHMTINVHNPKNPHEDIKRDVHDECYWRVKLDGRFPYFDLPTESDVKNPQLPFVTPSGAVVLRKLSEAFAKEVV